MVILQWRNREGQLDEIEIPASEVTEYVRLIEATEGQGVSYRFIY
jgi:hypothetical protein